MVTAAAVTARTLAGARIEMVAMISTLVTPVVETAIVTKAAITRELAEEVMATAEVGGAAVAEMVGAGLPSGVWLCQCRLPSRHLLHRCCRATRPVADRGEELERTKEMVELILTWISLGTR